jgi:prephenate dehydratase
MFFSSHKTRNIYGTKMWIVIAVFVNNGINITKIQSRYAKFMFLLNILQNGSVSNNRYQKISKTVILTSRNRVVCDYHSILSMCFKLTLTIAVYM